MPHIDANVAGGAPIFFEDTGGRLAYLEIVNEAPELAHAASCIFEGIVEHVHLWLAGRGAVGLLQGPGCSVRDSLLQAEGDGAVALHATDSETSEKTDAFARNVTAIATGPNSVGAGPSTWGSGRPSCSCSCSRTRSPPERATTSTPTGIGNKRSDHRLPLELRHHRDRLRRLPPGNSPRRNRGGHRQPERPAALRRCGRGRLPRGRRLADDRRRQGPGARHVRSRRQPRLLGPALDIGAYEFVPAATTAAAAA